VEAEADVVNLKGEATRASDYNRTAMVEQQGFQCGTRYFRDEAEYRYGRELRAVSFSEWYGGREASWSLTDNRYTSNAAAALFPDFYLELRDADEKPVGYLHTAPGFWSGDIESLPNFDHVVKTLNLRQRERLAAGLKYTLWHEWLGRPERFEQFARPLRARRQSQANAVLLLAMMVDPERRRHKLPTLLLNAAKDSARRLGYPYVMAPFRPSHYGDFKMERRAAHSEALFREYYAAQTAEGLPLDPWLRNVVRQGATLVKPEMRSVSFTRSIDTFNDFRQKHRPNDWYSPATDVWECGETCTWYIDRVQQTVTSWEPNCWGVIDVSPAT
jgi:GNAT superfamily N-acetyltransferase